MSMNYGIPKKNQKQPANIKGGIFILIIVGAVFYYLLHDSSPKEVKDMKGSAFVMSEEFVKRQLKAPATAEFPSDDSHVVYLGDSVFMINSYVDSQNSFGALLRNNYTAKVKYLGDDKWLPIEVNLLDQ